MNCFKEAYYTKIIFIWKSNFTDREVMLTTRVHYLIVLKKSMHYHVLSPCIVSFYLTHFCVFKSPNLHNAGNWHSKQSLWTVFLFHNLKISASICCKKKKKVSTESTWSSFCQLLREKNPQIHDSMLSLPLSICSLYSFHAFKL